MTPVGGGVVAGGHAIGTAGGRRHLELDCLKIIAAFAIVWYHSEYPGWQVAYSGLVVFLILSTYFCVAPRVGSSLNRGLNGILLRARRLLLPWVFWFLIYSAWNWAAGRALIGFDGGVVAGLLTGPSVHLWFLPFVFLILIFLDQITPLMSRTVLALSFGLASFSVIVSAYYWRPISMSFGYPWAQYFHAFAPACFGVFLGCRDALPSTLRRVIFTINIFACISSDLYDDIGMAYLVGFVAFGIFTRYRDFFENFARLASFERYAFGVYLLHPLVFSALRKFGFDLRDVFPGLVFLLVALIVVALRRALPRFSMAVM